MQNGFIERLNRTFREDILNAYQFETLEEVRILSDEWQHSYNNYYPRKSLKRRTPRATFEAFRQVSHHPQTIAEASEKVLTSNRQSFPADENR